MSCWLLILLFLVWVLWGAAAAAERAVDDARRGIPADQRGRVSIAPAIPFFPLGFWGLALLVDRVAEPWGTAVVGGFHAVLGVVFAISIVRDSRRLSRHTPRGAGKK
jgi:hypothetical protein